LNPKDAEAVTTQIECWNMTAPNAPMQRASREVDETALPPGTVLVKVAGCGVCHTDLGFVYDGVTTRHPLPLTLGHEISGRVTHAGPGAEEWVGRAVVVPAVIPCGECDACRSGHGSICPRQLFPGNDDHGGFATHVCVPSRGLCHVDDEALARSGLELADLAVIADAVTTPLQAILHANLSAGDVAVFVGIGGVGLFGVQIALAMGARVAAIDAEPTRVERAVEVGADWARVVKRGDEKTIKAELRAWAKQAKLPTTQWRIFETSGHPDGQALAFSLLNHGAHLGVVGYTREKTTIPLSNLMALDATARGTWGCLPEHYAQAVRLVLDGTVKLTPFTQKYPMSAINELFDDLHRSAPKKRPILIPDFETRP
jgi:6-hydroxycyclohex-1-ene-1-carbonyl-CoA dehydrogenase